MKGALLLPIFSSPHKYHYSVHNFAMMNKFLKAVTKTTTKKPTTNPNKTTHHTVSLTRSDVSQTDAHCFPSILGKRGNHTKPGLGYMVQLGKTVIFNWSIYFWVVYQVTSRIVILQHFFSISPQKFWLIFVSVFWDTHCSTLNWQCYQFQGNPWE